MGRSLAIFQFFVLCLASDDRRPQEEDRSSDEDENEKEDIAFKKINPPSLILTLIRLNGKTLLIGALWRALRLVTDLLNPLLLQ